MLFLVNYGSSVIVMSTITTAEPINHFSEEFLLSFSIGRTEGSKI